MLPTRKEYAEQQSRDPWIKKIKGLLDKLTEGELDKFNNLFPDLNKMKPDQLRGAFKLVERTVALRERKYGTE